MKKLFAGFWIGEFGWELMTWIPHVRAIAKDYDYVVVGCKPGHEPLYEFADEFVNLDYSGAKAEQWMNEPYDGAVEKVIKTIYHPRKYDMVLTPQSAYSYSMKTHAEWLTGLQPQEFKKIEPTHKIDVDIVLNIRYRTEHDSAFRNWDYAHALEFCSHFRDYRVACIGTYDQSLTLGIGNSPTQIVGAENNNMDMRLYKKAPPYPDQEYVNNLLCNAKVFVSSINGATHLASLCGCPQVSWVTKTEHKERLEKTWNPFKTKTKIFQSPDGDAYWRMREQWHPPVDELVEAVRAFL